jgi:hypothetical protein
MYHGADSIMPERPTSRNFRAAMTAALQTVIARPIGDLSSSESVVKGPSALGAR